MSRVLRAPKKLGKRQLAVLDLLVNSPDHRWEAGCGWGYGTARQTDSILDSLTTIGVFNYPLVIRVGPGVYKLGNRPLAITYVGGWL